MLGIRGSLFPRQSSQMHNGSSGENGNIDPSIINGEATMNGDHDGIMQSEKYVLGRTPKSNGYSGLGKETSVTYSQAQQVTILQETVYSTSGKIIRILGGISEKHIHQMEIENFLEYIERQRLTAMPHRGSHWDRVLKWAEFFALQISGYANTVEAFVPSSHNAAQLMWTCCQSLIELGQDNADPLSKTFGIFYELGLSLSLILRHDNLLHANSNVRHEVGHIYNDLLGIVRDVTLYYHSTVSALSSGQASLDFAGVFGSRIEAFLNRKERVVNAMWSFKLGDDATTRVQTLREWLNSRDASLRILHKQSILKTDHRGEFTCEWLQHHLLDFSRSQNDTWAIHGAAGTGKTFLSRWLVERLQRPIGKKTYDVLSYGLAADVPMETTSLAIAKRLCLQLLERSVGDIKLIDALDKARKMHKPGDPIHLENELWGALRNGLEQLTTRSNIIVIIDGLDEVKGGEHAAKTVVNHLGHLASHDLIKVITLSRNSQLKPKKGKTQSFEIKSDFTHEDLRQVTHQALHHYAHFKSQGEHAQEAIVEQIIHAAKGNFVWAFLTTSLLKEETSYENFAKAVKSIKETPKSLDATISKLLEPVDLSKSETNVLLSSMLVAERPLSAAEVQLLMQVDVQKTRLIDTNLEVRKSVTHLFRHLITLQNGFYRFRHSTIRAYIVSLANGQKLKTLPAMQADFTLRLLSYCTVKITQGHEPGFELVEKSYVNDLFAKHALLEYAIRHWTTHFEASSFASKATTLQLGNDFKNIFPDSATLVLLEWYCWGNQASSFDAHELALKIRRSVLGDKHVCVIQNLIVCGTIQLYSYKESSVGASFFYRAWHAAQIVLVKHSSVVLSCATKFLSITETMTFTSRTEVVTHREELLKYSIEMYTHHHGESHDLVICQYKLLAQLYVEIHEEHHAEVIWRKLQVILVAKFGKGSEEETAITEKLTIILKKGDKKTDITEYERGVFDVVAELEVWNIRRIEMTIELALSYESRKDFFKAEGCYIELWRRLTERAHHHGHHHGVDIHIRIIEVVIEYARFLIRCKRHEEASNILICIWTEYEEFDFDSELLFLRLKIVGEQLRITSLLSVALSVFRKCWSWFKSQGKIEHVKECEVLISTTTKEIFTVSSTTTVTTTTTTSTETIMKEIFESSITRTEVTSETITSCQTLISLYVKLERWTEAIEITRRSLFTIWKFITLGGGTAALPRNFGSEAIEIAITLAVCYLRAEQFHEAEEIYLRIYRACWNSCKFEDDRFLKVITTITKFYEEHRHWHSLIKIQQELLIAYREKLGAHHKMTIRILYALGGLCIEHGHGNGYEYYEEIAIILNGSGTVCHADSLDSMLVLCRHYYEAGHWHKLKRTCHILWETWKGQHHGHEKITAEFAAVLYLRYRYVLEHHEHSDYSILLQLAIEYRTTCIKSFGASVAISIKASLILAELYLLSEKHLHEAVSLYEETLTTISKTTTTTTTTVTTTTSTITTIKERLTSVYIRICSHESVSTSTLERAIIIAYERFELLKITLGWSHTETLVLLRELVLMHLRLKKVDCRTTVLRLLSESCIHVIKTEKHSTKLHEAAKTLGAIYVKCGMIEQAQTLITELRLHIVTGSSSSKDGADFKSLGSIGKVSYVFLVTFEQFTKEHTHLSYSDLMADLLYEASLYDSYHRLVKSQSSTETILFHAAKLRTFLIVRHRHSQQDVLTNQTFELFIRKWGQQIKGSREIKLLFFIDLMDEFGKEEREVQIGHAASAACIETVRHLLSKNRSQEAYEVAHYAHEFINLHHAWHQLQTIPYGFKLSALMAGRDPKQPLPKALDATLRKNMIELSRKIIREVLQACRESNINFVRMKPRELNNLSGLLGQQENFAELEWLLDLLWSSRDVQKSWKPPIIISIGSLFVKSRFLNRKHDKAVRLAEDITYNLRRVWGSLDPKTLKMEELLSAIYTSMGHHREAMGIHENILRLICEGDDGDDRTQDTASPEVVKRHIELLHQTYLRLKGWDKDDALYKDLVHSLLSLPQYKGRSELKSAGLHVENWSLKDPADDKLGKFAPPSDWEFAHENELDQKGDVKDDGYGAGRKRPGLGMKRVTSHWGIGEVRKALYGEEGGDGGIQELQYKLPHANGGLNGNGSVNGKDAAVTAAGHQTPEEEL